MASDVLNEFLEQLSENSDDAYSDDEFEQFEDKEKATQEVLALGIVDSLTNNAKSYLKQSKSASDIVTNVTSSGFQMTPQSRQIMGPTLSPGDEQIETESDRISRIEAFIEKAVPSRKIKKPEYKIQNSPSSSDASRKIHNKKTCCCDQLRAEIDRLQMLISNMTHEYESIEARLASSKKINKKLMKQQDSLEEALIGYEEIKASHRLMQDREAALLEAVTELTEQNQDLIAKLKISMQRELEQSLSRAAVVNNNLTNKISSFEKGHKLEKIDSIVLNPVSVTAYSQHFPGISKPKKTNEVQPRRIHSDGSVVEDSRNRFRRRNTET